MWLQAEKEHYRCDAFCNSVDGEEGAPLWETEGHRRVSGLETKLKSAKRIVDALKKGY